MKLVRQQAAAAASAARELGINPVRRRRRPIRALGETHDLVVAADVAEFAFPRNLRGGLQARHHTQMQVRGSAPPRNSTTPSPSSSRRPNTAGCGAHALPVRQRETATFIIETSEETWEKFGFGAMSQQESIAVHVEDFENGLGGHAGLINANCVPRLGSIVILPACICSVLSHKNLALMAMLPRAHFSIEPGTKLALESYRARRLRAFRASLAVADKYEDARRIEALKPAVGGAQLAGMVRGVGGTPPPLDPCTNYSLPTRRSGIALRESAAARPGLATMPRRGSSAVPAIPAMCTARRCSHPSPARPEAGEPRRRLVDGARARPWTVAQSTGTSLTMPSAGAARASSISR